MRHAVVLGAALGVSLLSAAAPGAEAPAVGVASHVNRARDQLLGEHPTEAQVREGFLHVLDALQLIAPETRIGGAWPGKLAEARRLIDAGSLVEPRAVALLGECYREAHGGRDFEMPAAVHTIADAREHIRIQLAVVPDLVKTGSNDEAARRMLEAVVAIVTPMHR